tara:strand:+ start:93 stop:770 length:678 start_codon:yes stop_codon:yes gene_type:complete
MSSQGTMNITHSKKSRHGDSYLVEMKDYVYYKMLNREIYNQQHAPTNTNEIILKGIKEVDGIKCNVILFVNYGEYMLRIESKYLIEPSDCRGKIYYNVYIKKRDATEENEKKLKIIKRDDISLCIDKLIVKLQKIKFNNFTGKFTEHKINEKIYDVFKLCNVTIEEGEECSVCYEKTLTKTNCKHSVCYRCIEKLPITHDDDDCPNISCPICRHNVIWPLDDELN